MDDVVDMIMRGVRWFVLVPVSALLLACANYEDSLFEAKATLAYLHMEMSGDLGLVRSNSAQTPGEVNHKIHSDLNLQKADTPYVRFDLGKAPIRGSISGFQAMESGRSRLTTSFGDIGIGTDVKADMTMFNIKAVAMLDVVDTGLFRLSPGIALDYFDIDFEMKDVNGTASEEVRFQAPVPMPILEMELDFGPLAVQANFGGIYVDLADAKGLFWDGEAMITYSPTPAVELLAGYRFARLDSTGVADSQRFGTETLLHGVFLGGSIGF